MKRSLVVFVVAVLCLSLVVGACGDDKKKSESKVDTTTTSSKKTTTTKATADDPQDGTTTTQTTIPDRPVAGSSTYSQSKYCDAAAQVKVSFKAFTGEKALQLKLTEFLTVYSNFAQYVPNVELSDAKQLQETLAALEKDPGNTSKTNVEIYNQIPALYKKVAQNIKTRCNINVLT